jgi:5-deoxy-glucuronate isomerase
LFLAEAGKEFSDIDEKRETALSVFSGKCDIEIEEGETSEKASYQEIGKRADVFSGAPTMVYIPKGVKYTMKSNTGMLDIGIFKAPSRRNTKPVLIKPEDNNLITPGVDNWQRKVYGSIGEKVDADRLIVGETYTPSGNWSSYPPHKHDSYNPPKEAPYEEVYFFLIKPAKGFGIQRIYTSSEAKDPLNEVYVIENNDTVVIPRGYHPVVAAAGYQLYYFWALAGEERIYAAWSDDPEHSWLRNCEPILNQ